MPPSLPAPPGITIRLNDRGRTVAAGTTLAALVDALGLAGRGGLAIAVNGAIVPRQEWPRRQLAAGEELLVVGAAQGG